MGNTLSVLVKLATQAVRFSISFGAVSKVTKVPCGIVPHFFGWTAFPLLVGKTGLGIDTFFCSKEAAIFRLEEGNAITNLLVVLLTIIG